LFYLNILAIHVSEFCFVSHLFISLIYVVLHLIFHFLFTCIY